MTGNYPPGVTGNEPQIAGWETDETCEVCGYPLIDDPEAGIRDPSPLCSDCQEDSPKRGKCEDYPCCGHTFADPCEGHGWVSGEEMLANPALYHIGCDHETGYCEYEPDDDGEEDS